jgi:anaerobic glycerol-3-phosphate dehydrogenase
LRDYPEHFLATAAQKLAYLPDGSAVEQMLDDYRYLRRQLQDWHTMTCNR